VSVGVGVFVGVSVGVGVFVGVSVGVGVFVGVSVGVGVFVGVSVGVGVFVGVLVAVGVFVAVLVGVGVFVGVLVGVLVGDGHGGKLTDFAVLSVCSTRMVFTPALVAPTSSGPNEIELEFAVTVTRLPGISRKKPSDGMWSVT
jgi:hypothetical protein